MSNTSLFVNRHDVLLLGGIANSLSVARCLGKNNINVNIASPIDCVVAKSRHIKNHFVQPENLSREDFYYDLLLQQDKIKPEAVIFACDDDAISVIAKNKDFLKKKYILDIQKPEHQLDLLDKQKTIELAKKVNCPAPKYWQIEKPEDVIKAIPDITFPVLIKPIYSHIFHKQFNKKLFFAEDRKRLIEYTNNVFNANIEFMLCEFIPGPDSLLSSYYTFIDNDGNKHFDFTKQIERRSPVHFGGGTYHRTQWLPETAAMGIKFFKGIDFRGMGNIEFKYDARDNQLKVIECNARFTAAQELVTQSGMDMPGSIYQYLVNRQIPEKMTFKDKMTMVLPFEDIDAFRELHQQKKITLVQWLKSLLRPHIFAYYNTFDCKPFVFSLYKIISTRLKNRFIKHKKHAKKSTNNIYNQTS